jgi:hypothetical protein
LAITQLDSRSPAAPNIRNQRDRVLRVVVLIGQLRNQR